VRCSRCRETSDGAATASKPATSAGTNLQGHTHLRVGLVWLGFQPLGGTSHPIGTQPRKQRRDSSVAVFLRKTGSLRMTFRESVNDFGEIDLRHAHQTRLNIQLQSLEQTGFETFHRDRAHHRIVGAVFQRCDVQFDPGGFTRSG
jgi:hypothetical protein